MIAGRDDVAILTVGQHARDALAASPVAGLCRRAEGLCDPSVRQDVERELRRATLASVVVDARDVSRDRRWIELARLAVSLARNRLSLRPLVALDVPPASAADWRPERLLSLSRGLGAPVVRAADASELAAWRLALLWSESLAPGVACIAASDLESAFGRASGGIAFRWTPAAAPPVLPPALTAVLRGGAVASALVTYRFSRAGTLHRMSEVAARVAAAAPDRADVVLAAPVVEGVADEVVVTLIHGRRP